MAEVAIQKENGPRGQGLARRIARDWDPFRAMRDILRFDPFTELAPAWPELEGAAFAPAFDVKETKDAFIFKADLPGVKESDLDVKIAQNRLTVSGKRESEKTEKGDTFYTYERSYGSFSRTFTLPEGVDADRIKADLKEGVLSIEAPKRPEARPKKISVKT